jgi:hypothetical protein
MIRANKFYWPFALALAMACCGQPASAQMSIGSAAIIRNDVEGVRGVDARALATGAGVFSDDQVKTGDNSFARLVFLDQTKLAVAANSEAVLREVYHPQQGVNQLVMKTVAGSFRFVSGAQSAHNYQVEFPQGYLTVRGTIVDLLAGPDRSLVVLVEGSITVAANATNLSRDLTAPGTSLIVYNDGRMDGPLSREAAVNQLGLPANHFTPTMWAALEAGTATPALNLRPNPCSTPPGSGGIQLRPQTLPPPVLPTNTASHNPGNVCVPKPVSTHDLPTKKQKKEVERSSPRNTNYSNDAANAANAAAAATAIMGIVGAFGHHGGGGGGGGHSGGGGGYSSGSNVCHH